MNRYRPLKANATSHSTFYIDSQVPSKQLFKDAYFRIRAATGLLEALTSVTMTHTNDSDLYHVILPIYVLLQDGVDTLEQINFKGAAING
ncbi:hypothetical protein GIW70_18075 [Pseudomonas syringae]|nr:hypothetical protein [Pseudomonas syringae]MCF5070098.1 hypothetical protein [Pseudomonas syringae]